VSHWFRPQRSIGHRFVAYLMVLSILPLLALGLASFEISRSALQVEAERHLSRLLSERKRYVDLQTEQTEDLIANISGVEAITTGLSTPYDPADDYARLSMQARIGYILNGYVNIRGLVSIDIYSPSGAHYHVGDTLDVGTLRHGVLEELRRHAAASTRPVYWAGLIDNVNGNSRHTRVITAAKVIYGFRPETSEQTPLGLLLVNYSPGYLSEQFGELASDGAVQVALADAGGRLMAHPDSKRIGTLLDADLKQRLNGEAGSFLWEVDGSPTLVSYRRSEPSGWPLVGFISLPAINAHALAIGKATALVALLCLGVAGIAALSYSRHVVTPLRRITDRFKQLRSDRAHAQEHLPVHGEDDIAELTRCFNAFLDGLHEQERAEQALKQAEAERQARLAAEASSEAKSLFLAKMSHDLRTPLNAVLGYAQLLKRDKDLNKRQATGLEAIRSSGEHLLMLINDILDLSKIEAGKLELYLHDVDLKAFLKGIAVTIRVKAEEKSLGFSLVASPGLPLAVRCDPKRLCQVLLNLLDNAVKFTDLGRVTLRVRAMSASEEGAVRLRFEVEDSGVGIIEQEMEACFQPFEQVGEEKRRSAGTGLGLAISRQLVRVMGGEIRVHSIVGRGTCFWFDLTVPRAEASPQALPMARNVVGYRGQRKRVLVVDDVAENRALVNNFLVPLGFETFEAENGRVSLEKAQVLRPDLILMDTVMPVMDGLEATRELRRKPELAAVPVISVSAIASSADRSRSLEAGANTFLVKPIDLDVLTSEVGLLLNLSWIYDAPAPPPTVADQAEAAVVMPPPDALEELHRLARLGSMSAIHEHADRIAALGDPYRSFADKLHRMADGFQSVAILQFAQQCIDTRVPSDSS
jgi:signal transduction histidine kinase/DNA-binding NarL/FixJ family response regulator